MSAICEVTMNDNASHKQKQTKRHWKGTYSHKKEAKSHAFAKTLRKRLTDAEVILWQNLRRKSLGGLKFRRQHPIGPYIADFVCLRAKLIVEVDGATHATEAEIAHDRRRRAFMSRFGWKEIRAYNDDVYKNLDGVLEAIWREAKERLTCSAKSQFESE